MFPSSIFYNDQQQAFPNISILSDNSTHGEPPPSSFFHTPSSYMPHGSDLELELQVCDAFFQQNHQVLLHQHQPLRGITGVVSETIANMEELSQNEVSDVTKVCSYTISQVDSTKKKRSSKRDRHSKINTAQGPRDRRMRLSLKVARDFFGLQDKLGFDKPSKTVEWLLVQAKHEIMKLSAIGPKSASSTSDGEVVSGIDNAPVKESATKSNVSLDVRKQKKTRAVRKTGLNPRAKETRDMARAKARERTKEKMARKFDEEKATEQVHHQLGCSFETGEESTQTHNLNPSVDVTSHAQHQFGTADSMIDPFEIISNWSPSSSSSSIFNDGISQAQHQFTDLQCLYKPWEVYNNIQSLR